MGKTLKYVKDFDFNAKPCNYSSGGATKSASKKYAIGGDVKADIRGAIDRSVAAGDRNFVQKLGDLRKVNLGGNSSLTIGGGLRKPTITYTKRFKEGGDVKMASGGYYSKGGSCGDVKMASGGYYNKGGRMAAGGATGSPPQDPAYQAVRKAAKAATSPENLRTRLAQFGQPQATPLAKGGAAKAKAAKIGKVMGEYKSGELHSGSKKGPVVKNRKQAIAIAMSEAGKSKNRA